MKGCGKTILGTLLAEKWQIPFIDLDTEIEQVYKRDTGENISFCEIFKKYGELYFNELVTKSLRSVKEEFSNSSFVFVFVG